MMAVTFWNRPTSCVFLTGALLAATAFAASPRFARLGAFEGSVEVQLDPAETWRPALVNLPLPESTRIRTGPNAKVEIELDDLSVLRMVGEGLAELSDYTRLSGGQRITVISLDHGRAYFTGEPNASNTIYLLVPGAQATLKQGSRIRLIAIDSTSEVAVIEGATKFTIPTAEMDLHQGQSARVTVPESSNFSLFREIAPADSDAWSEQLDKAQAQAPASRLDLDRAGKWIAAGEFGTVWQPKPEAGWAPFRQGRWLWFQAIGFTWVGGELWGWKPYHEGRWLQHPDLGWVWQPGPKDADFAPGAVFWARATNMAVWGALAPGEQWNGAGPPRQFAAFNITGGTFSSGSHEILPSSAEDLPKDLLKAFLFTAALPSPPLPASRLTVARDALRTRMYKAVEPTPAVPDVTEALPPQPSDSQPVADATPAPAAMPPPVSAPPAPDPEPPDAVYNYPVYTGIIVVNPPEKGDPSRRRNNKSSGGGGTPVTNNNPPASSSPGGPGSGGTGSTPPPRATNKPPAQQPGHRNAPVESRPERTERPSPASHRAETPPTPRPIEPTRTTTPAAVRVEAPRSNPAPAAASKADAPAKTDTATISTKSK